MRAVLPALTDAEVASNLEEQNDEEEALSAIFDDNFARLHDVTPTSPDFFSPSHAAQGAAAGWRAAGAREFEYEVSIEVKFSDFGARVFLGARDDAAREEAGENAGGGGAAGALMYYAIEHLPPVRLRWRNVPTYPSHTPPEFRVSVDWLSDAQILRVEKALEEMYAEAPGCEVIFKWCNMLSSQLLASLDLLPSFAVVPCGDGLQAVAYTRNETEEDVSPERAGGGAVVDDAGAACGGGGGGQGGRSSGGAAAGSYSYSSDDDFVWEAEAFAGDGLSRGDDDPDLQRDLQRAIEASLRDQNCDKNASGRAAWRKKRAIMAQGATQAIAAPKRKIMLDAYNRFRVEGTG